MFCSSCDFSRHIHCYLLQKSFTKMPPSNSPSQPLLSVPPPTRPSYPRSLSSPSAFFAYILGHRSVSGPSPRSCLTASDSATHPQASPETRTHLLKRYSGCFLEKMHEDEESSSTTRPSAEKANISQNGNRSSGRDLIPAFSSFVFLAGHGRILWMSERCGGACPFRSVPVWFS